ncbi:methyltransferase domain-containing protein [Noviherbaspirillum sp. UKPF54]|uniref:methyltransferase domain-containing protein n=1 Tax=Noviherbaspirillum sp. UKPF54 TaxID=2601898 RepID=UPI0011B0F8BF|nr:methyltransferase domain-containing protein [Noviherbaspirillum sp. UKPF54]QDZ27478.1 class I SAM-dependent methyltransferase [Noviherbaspirillum sp. UKPF54]
MKINQSQSLAEQEATQEETEPAVHQPTLKVVYEAPKSQNFPIHKVYKIFQDYFRPRRKRAFMKLFPEVASGAPVVDLGGTAGWWKEDFPESVDISIVNIDDDHREEVTQSGFKFFRTDGRSLPFADKEFHLAFSNSVIEHVGDLGDQKRFAHEAMRCGRKLYLQTPNKWFPVEPHLMTAFIQWLPFKMSRRLLRYFSLWGLVAKPSQKQIDEFLRTTRLLSRSELKQIFPTAQIKEEKFLGMTKSFIVLIQ